MKNTLLTTLLLFLLTVGAASLTAGPVAPNQVGEYVGTAKWTTYDLGEPGKKKTETIPCSMTISAADNNTVTFRFGNDYDETVTYCPFGPNNGGFFQGAEGGPKCTAVFKLKGNGDKVSIKGEFHYINPYLLSTGTFKLKKLP